MSMCLNLVCDQCRKGIWVGQHANSTGWYVYTGMPKTVAALNSFVNAHIDHPVRFIWDDAMPIDYDEDESVYEGGDEAMPGDG
jgi:hypothetical protein